MQRIPVARQRTDGQTTILDLHAEGVGRLRVVKQSVDVHVVAARIPARAQLDCLDPSLGDAREHVVERQLRA